MLLSPLVNALGSCWSLQELAGAQWDEATHSQVLRPEMLFHQCWKEDATFIFCRSNL